MQFPIARIAYMLSLWINPNNHALDGGRASSALEKEAVAEIASLFGWDRFLGHLTGGGTMANIEALWIAGKLMGPGKKVAQPPSKPIAPTNACRMCSGCPFKPLPAMIGPGWT
jgi:glutamate/tyrosine decarboxylase-like PLP-dependent enzyme